MLHAHITLVSLFVLHYLIKTVMLVKGSPALEGYVKKTKVVEMIISFLFLVTGVMLFLDQPDGEINPKFFVKVIMVLASIPLAIIGFKKGKKPLAIISVILLLGAFGMAESIKADKGRASKVEMEEMRTTGNQVSGEDIFTTQCTLCHGADGKQGTSGAKDLSISILTQQEKVDIITNGKGQMTSYAKVLSKEEIESVATYIETLKK
jgi:cytochrome c553